MSAGGGGAPLASPRELLRLAWPAALSYLLNNTYRINDQFWIQGLGPAAQAAMAGVLFLTILNFALIFVAVGGTLSLVARATGAADPARRDAVIRNGLFMGVAIALVLTVAGPLLTPRMVAGLGLEGETAEHARAYLGTLYLLILPMALAPLLDHVFLGMGNSRLPALLQVLAVLLNGLLNPVLIYGSEPAASLPGARAAAAVAGFLGLEARGMAGAAIATALSRAISVAVGLVLLTRIHGVRLLPAAASRWRPDLRLCRGIARVSVPVSLSILFYSAVYLVLVRLVLVPLGPEPLAALGLGFMVFEGISYPCFLGLSMAAASLVGRSLGAGRPELALEMVRLSQRMAWILGAIVLALFLTLAPAIAPLFTSEPGVLRELRGYLLVIAFAQPCVAQEAVHEKVLLGSGHTRPAMWVSMLGNGLRVPLCWFLGLGAGWGSLGVWAALSVTSLGKALLLWRMVRRRSWLAAEPAPERGSV